MPVVKVTIMMMLVLINVKCSTGLPFIISFRKPKILISIRQQMQMSPKISLHARKNVILTNQQNTEGRFNLKLNWP